MVRSSHRNSNSCKKVLFYLKILINTHTYNIPKSINFSCCACRCFRVSVCVCVCSVCGVVVFLVCECCLGAGVCE